MLRDIRIAARTLRHWGFGALVAVATLAVGIGSATTLYTVLRVVLEGSAPAIDGLAQIGRLYATSPSLGVERTLVTVSDFDQTLAGARSFEAMAAYTSAELAVGTEPSAETWSVTRVSPAFFTVLRARSTAGRLFTAADFTGSRSVAVVSEAIWRRKFPDRSINETPTLWMAGAERRVVGVLPQEFEFPFIGVSGDAWIPLAADGSDAEARVAVIARLRGDISWTKASAELGTFAPPLRRDSSYRWQAIPLDQDTRKRLVNATGVTLMPALIVLIIACVNVSCMLLARGVRRDTELSIRAALGASRGRIFGQLLTESMVLAGVGGIGGAFLALGAIRLIGAVLLPLKPAIAAQVLSGLGLLPAALASATLACVVFGALPAVRLSRRDIASSLKGVASTHRVRVAGYGARDLVVFFELGFAVVLVAVAAMWLSFFTMLQQSSPSFPADEVVIDRIASQDLAPITERVRAIPGVDRLTIASDRPGRLRARTTLLRATSGRVARGALLGVSESFFETLGLEVVRGRTFDSTESGRGVAVVVVTQSVAAALWPEEDALGKEVFVDSPTAAPLRVIGVSRNPVEFGGLGILHAGDAYRPLDVAATDRVTLLVRGRNAKALIRQVAVAAHPSPLSQSATPVTFADAVAAEFSQPEGLSLIQILTGFGLVALLLAASGIFGVISETLAQRTTEFGVRMALGATTARILRMVLAREVQLIGAAIGASAVATVMVTRTLFAELVAVSAGNPQWPVALMLACGVIALAATGLAAYRIVRLDAWEVLRRV